MSGFARRLAGIPWREIPVDAFSRAFLVAQAFCAVHVVHSHVFSFSLAPGVSMLPAMNLAGDVVAVDRVSGRRGRVASGYVVLLISPENPRMTVAKHVLGMEGDAVTYLVDPGNSEASKPVVLSSSAVAGSGGARSPGTLSPAPSSSPRPSAPYTSSTPTSSPSPWHAPC